MEETKKNPFLTAAMNGGALMGSILIIYNLILYFFNLTTSTKTGYLVYFFIAIGLYLIAKQFRDKELGGTVTYGKAFSFSITVGLFASIIMAFFTYIELQFIDPDLIEKQLKIVEQAYLDKGISEDQIEAAMNMSRKFATPLPASLLTVLSLTFMSGLISLLTSIFVQKKNKNNPFSQAMNEFPDNVSNTDHNN